MNGRELYGDAYYETRHDRTVYSAQTILAHALDLVPEVTSAVDVGCRVGTWLFVLRQGGVVDTVEG